MTPTPRTRRAGMGKQTAGIGSDMADTDAIAVAVRKIDATATVDDVAEALALLAGMKERIKDLEAELEERMVDYVSDHGSITIGETRYWVGPRKTTRCVNVPGAIQALLEATGGDFETFCTFLSSQPLKHGACREPLGEQWPFYFQTQEELELKTGQPLKRLQKADTRFLK